MKSRTGTLIFLAATATALAAEVPHFSREVLPLLSENCLACHGQDEKQRKAGLRLDTREGAIAVKDGVAAIVPGKPKESELLTRIVSDDEDEVMPPPKSHKKRLSAEEVAMLTRWIEAGAPWGKHWAFERPEKVALPKASAQSSVRSSQSKPGAQSEALGTGHWALGTNPIDAFIRARLEKEKLTPPPEAPRHTLARRVAFDLAGLPPSPEALATFEKDTMPGAYERYVDSLLASPHFGERMAM